MKLRLALLINITFLVLCETLRVKINKVFVAEVPEKLSEDNLQGTEVKILQFLQDGDSNKTIRTISNFSKLAIIVIKRHNITKIPEFRNISELRVIDLTLNFINNVQLDDFGHVEKLDILNLAFNNISNIEDRSFPKKLAFISLRCNQLTQISTRWFQYPANLLTLHLENNKISVIRRILFEQFLSLVHLDLSGNRIASIDEGAFRMDSVMGKIKLGSNLLTVLPANIFSSSTISVKYLDISNNRLNYLSEDFIKKLYGFHMLKPYVYFSEKFISLYGNPWQCPCAMKMDKLLIDYGVVQVESAGFEDNPKCIYSLQYTNVCIEHVNPELYETYSKSVGFRNNSSTRTCGWLKTQMYCA